MYMEIYYWHEDEEEEIVRTFAFVNGYGISIKNQLI